MPKEIYNAGMRGKKRTMWEGGHRVPLFVRWPDGGLKHGNDVAELTQVQDLVPTLLNLCEVKPANLYPQDGVDLGPLLKGKDLGRMAIASSRHNLTSKGPSGIGA
jgi:arylsulfatase A-like enzyme